LYRKRSLRATPAIRAEGTSPGAIVALDEDVCDLARIIEVVDRVEAVVDAVLEDRTKWVSVRDAVAVLVGRNLGELGVSLATGVLAEPALNARQLLLVNLRTDVAPAMAIALRPPPPTTAEALRHEGPEASPNG